MVKITLLSLTLIFFALSAIAGECPELPDQPEISQHEIEFKAAWQWFAEPYSVYDYAGSRDRAPLGVGHLKVEYTDHGYYDWPRKIVLPLWHKPGGEFLAWLRGGLVISADGAEPFPLSGPGMVETEYEQSTIIVTEVQGNWLKLCYRTGTDGIAWAHRCYLGLGEILLGYQSWQELLTEHGEWLNFRADVPHVLRAGPSTGSENVTVIGLDHKLTLLKIEGDWMQVEVTQPDWTCRGSDQPFTGKTHRGWVKWRDDEIGPWVWYYTRGC
jgi:hypothetical protein